MAQFEKATVVARLAAPTPAELVLLDLGINSPADIDLEAIAWTLGARVRYRPLDSCEARRQGRPGDHHSQLPELLSAAAAFRSPMSWGTGDTIVIEFSYAAVWNLGWKLGAVLRGTAKPARAAELTLSTTAPSFSSMFPSTTLPSSRVTFQTIAFSPGTTGRLAGGGPSQFQKVAVSRKKALTEPCRRLAR